MSEYYFGITDPGKVRDNNEDAFLVEPLDGNARILAAVIDGVGGYEGGEVAAGIAKQRIAELLTRPLDDVPAALSAALIEINERIVEARASMAGREMMACVLTVAVADLAANQFYYAHVGDTRLYLQRGASLVKVSRDHSFVGFLEESNRISEQEAMRHPKRNEVNKVLGADPDIGRQPEYIDTGSSPFLPGDTLLLCSDGLTDMIDTAEIAGLLGSGASIPDKARALVDAANKAGGQDNVTVVLVQNPNAPASYEPTMPLSKKKNPRILSAPDPEVISPRPKSSKLPLWLLSILCLGLAGALAWQLMQNNKPVPTSSVAAPPPPAPTPVLSPAGQQLRDSLTAASGSFIIDTAVFNAPVQLSDTLRINQDSFVLSGNGLVLRGDSSLKGPGLLLSARYVVLEDIVFESFPVAILAENTTLVLRNVRFRACGIPVSYSFRFPDMQSVHGVMHADRSFKTDSLNRPWP